MNNSKSVSIKDPGPGINLPPKMYAISKKIKGKLMTDRKEGLEAWRQKQLAD